MKKAISINHNSTDLALLIFSFGVTVIRMGIIFLTSYTILQQHQNFKELAIINIALVMLLDYYDGVFFRKSNYNSIKRWRINRRLFDSITDKVITHTGSISLLIIDNSFIWIYLCILIRDIAIGGYCSISFSKGLLLYPASISKISMIFVGLSIMFYLTGILALIFFSICAMLVLSIISFANYYKRANLNYCKRSKGNEMLEVF